MNDGAAPLGDNTNEAYPETFHARRKYRRAESEQRPTFSQNASAQKAKQQWFVLAMIVLGLVNAPLLLGTPVGQRGMLAGVIGGILLMLVIKSPRDGMVMTLLFLGVLGGLRRWLIPVLGWPPQDPLVLVQGAIVGGSFLFLMGSGRLPWDTRLSRCVACLLGIMFFEIFNPAQGGIAIGFAGVLFMIVPLLWYYAGRQLGTSQIVVHVLRAALVLSLLGAMYGLYQTWFGFSASELIWGRIVRLLDDRPFSFYTTMAEYGMFLAIGVAVLWAAFLKGNRAAILPIPFLIVSIFFLSERGVVVGSLMLCTVLWAVQGRSLRVWVPRALLALVLAGSGLVWSLHQAQNATFGSSTQALVEHQTSGLLDPGKSTAPLHATMMLSGVMEGFTSPLGSGLGSTTEAANKFGKGTNSSEADFSDAFRSLGVFGGILYALMMVLILLTAVREWIRTRSFVSLAILGVLLASIGHWLHGGYYAVSMLAWFLIGATDRAAQLAKTTTRAQESLSDSSGANEPAFKPNPSLGHVIPTRPSGTG